MESLDLIRNFLKDHLAVSPESVQPESSLAELGVDSLMMLELLFELEDRYNIKLPQDMAPPKTIREIIAQFEKHIAATEG